MAATRSRWVRPAALAVLFIGFHAALIGAVVTFAFSGQPPEMPTPPPVAVAAIVPESFVLPAPPTAPTEDDDVDDELPAEVPIPAPAAPVPPVPTEAPAPAAPVVTVVPASPGSDDTAAALPAPSAPRWTPEQLQASLLGVPEIWLQPPTVPTVAKTGGAYGISHPVLSVIDARPDLRGLAVRRGPDAQLPPAEAEAFRDASVLLRQELSELTRGGTRRADPSRTRRLAFRPEVYAARPQVVARVLHQMIQVESVALRKVLVGKLKQLRHATATQALAHRAVYEPVPELRQAAVDTLVGRSPADYLPTLLEAFRSPWPPAADHAADALITLAPAEAVPGLTTLLDSPGLSAAAPDERGVPTVRELVRVNHSRNCLLCHAQSVNSRDGIRVAVPNPTRRLPSAFSLDTYEGGGRGGARVPRDTVFARPDITYLQQDFSWVLPVTNPGPWPALQRYDFVIRRRPATADEVAAAGQAGSSPQRQAVRRALDAVKVVRAGPRD